MKKIRFLTVCMLFILMVGFHGIQAFEVDDNYYYILEGLEVYKNGDDLYVGEFRLHENKFPKTGSKVHEKKSFSKDILVAQDGWYELEFIGRKIPVIFGGNYFTYHDPQDPNSSVYNADEQFYEEAKKRLTGRAIKGGIDYSVFCGMRTRQISSIKVPDVLEENLGGKRLYMTPQTCRNITFLEQKERCISTLMPSLGPQVKILLE